MPGCQGKGFYGGTGLWLPEDVQAVAGYVLAHRLILSSKARLNDRTAEDLLTEILETVPVPRLLERRG